MSVILEKKTSVYSRTAKMLKKSIADIGDHDHNDGMHKEYTIFDQQVMEEQKALKQISLERLRKSFSTLLDAFHFVSYVQQEETMEKGLGGTRAPQKRPVALPSSDKFVGHVGAGMRPAGKTTRRYGPPKADIPSPGSSASSSSPSISVAMMQGKKNVPVSKENWLFHPDLQQGSFAFVQHPFDHDTPQWCRIISLGKHGVSVRDSDEKPRNIRWEHVHDIKKPVHDKHESGDQKEALLMLGQMGMPMDIAMLDPRQHIDAEDLLRDMKAPLIRDLITNDHPDRDDAYESLMAMNAPVDIVEATRTTKQSLAKLPDHVASLIKEAQKRGAPIDLDKLAKFSKTDILKVLKFYFGDEREKDESV